MQLRPSEGRTLQFEIPDDSRTGRLLEMKGIGSCDARTIEHSRLTDEREQLAGIH